MTCSRMNIGRKYEGTHCNSTGVGASCAIPLPVQTKNVHNNKHNTKVDRMQQICYKNVTGYFCNNSVNTRDFKL